MNEDLPVQLTRSYAPAVHKRLSGFPSRDQVPIGSWLLQNAVGTNYALQILDQLDDLSRREECGAAKVLFGVLSLLPADKLQPKEIGRRLRDELQRRLHPASGEHRAAFEDWSGALKLPENVRLIPPQNFEGRQFTLALGFESTEELRQRLEASLALLKNPDWEKIWSF